MQQSNPMVDLTAYEDAKSAIRQLRHALNQLSLANIRRGIDNTPIIEARAYVNDQMDFLQSDPDAYLADMQGELSPLACLLGVILYRDMVQS
jgi:hypothetical protein